MAELQKQKRDGSTTSKHMSNGTVRKGRKVSMPTEEVIMSIQSENQNILTDHSQTSANCTSPQITPSFEWKVTEPDKALNDNNPQQFPI